MSRLVGAAGGALTHVIWTFRPVCERDARRSYRSGPRRPAVWCHGSMIRRTGFTSVSRRAISTQDPASGETVSNDCRNPGARRSLMAPAPPCAADGAGVGACGYAASPQVAGLALTSLRA